MKPALTAALFALFAAPAFGARVSLPRLPAPSSFDAEVSTNIALNVNASRLERLSCSIALEACATNEVLFAIGHDLDSDGNLTFGEAALVFGCDCGSWYRADLRTGETFAPATNALVIGKREFDPSWNLAKVVRRGTGDPGETVFIDEEHVRFSIRVR